MSNPLSARWNSSLGFGLAALGSAVGLGNIWRFPYVMGEYGGGAFLLAYLLSVLVLGWPLLIAEISIGRHTHTDSIAACRQIAPGRPWRWAGWLGFAACILILAYYPVIAGWVLHYLWLALHGDLGVMATDTQAARFTGITQNTGMAIGAGLLTLGAATAIVAGGVAAGIERSSRILMPLFACLLLALAVYSFNLPGRVQAMTFMFRPEWSALLRADTWLVAFGQALFSIGLAMGILVTYGSYLAKSADLPRIAGAVIAGDTLIALLASLVIFPAVFSMGLAPAQGPGLVFVVLPEVFATMPGGRIAGAVFFLLLLIAALTSIVSLLEVPVSLLMSRQGMARLPATLLTGAGAFLLGVPIALGEGLSALQFEGWPTLLGMADQATSHVLLPLSAMAIALLVGWHWRAEEAQVAAGLKRRFAQRYWWFCMRYLVPVLLVIVLVAGLGDS